jgi:hypothetical protein
MSDILRTLETLVVLWHDSVPVVEQPDEMRALKESAREGAGVVGARNGDAATRAESADATSRVELSMLDVREPMQLQLLGGQWGLSTRKSAAQLLAYKLQESLAAIVPHAALVAYSQRSSTCDYIAWSHVGGCSRVVRVACGRCRRPD